MAGHEPETENWVLWVAARGRSYDEAAEVLADSAAKVAARQVPTDKRSQAGTLEPGGGGPYEQRFVMVPIVVEPLGVAANGNDDED